MISRIFSRTVNIALRTTPRTLGLLTVPSYSFNRKIEKAPSNFNRILQDEIKAEEENLTDLSEQQTFFDENGWNIKRESVLVELSKTIGPYQVRLVSNIKSPSNFNENEEKKEPSEDGQNYEGQMNEVTICVTKQGSEKTMVVNSIVTQGFEVTNVLFKPNYEEAKKSRLDIFSGSSYTGPEMESLSDELFEGIYGFLQQECQVNDELLENFGDYCINAQQEFYINWLKDLKSIL